MQTLPAFKQPATSKQGHHAKCACCSILVWVDTTHGTQPGPVFSGEACFYKWHEERGRSIPSWAALD